MRAPRLGVTSFIVSLIGVVLLGGSVAAVIVLFQQNNAGVERSGPKTAAGLGVILGLVLSLLGTVLGAVALAKEDRRRAFAVLGLTINLFLLAAVGGLLVIGWVK